APDTARGPGWGAPAAAPWAPFTPQARFAGAARIARKPHAAPAAASGAAPCACESSSAEASSSSGAGGLTVSSPAAREEREADAIAGRILAGGPATVAGDAAAPQIHRSCQACAEKEHAEDEDEEMTSPSGAIQRHGGGARPDGRHVAG